MNNIDFEKIQGRKILVIGDVMIDTYHIGKVKRISPEAPVPIVQITQSYSVLGGASNVVRNLIGLKCSSHILGVIGKDYNGDMMLNMLHELNVENTLIRTEHPTITKTRVLGNNQQIVRLDFEQDKQALSDSEQAQLIDALDKYIPQYDLVIISDYGKGVCTEDICRKAISIAHLHNKPIVIDPKGVEWRKYSNATIVTPNIKEFSDILGYEVRNTDESIEAGGYEVLKKYNIQNLLVTRSEKGMTLISERAGCINIKTEAKEIFDVSGAGDTVVATLAAALSASLSMEEAVYLSNKAAGIVVGKMGTSPILYNELLDKTHLQNDNKVLRLSSLKDKIATFKSKNKKIVFTNGCFDILHRGHIHYLREAKKLGDILILGLNSDASVKRLKGKSRPINNQDDRAEVLEALESIDYIVVFDDDTPYELIKEIAPDILVKGGDYTIEGVIGREFAKEVVLIDFQNGYSTTKVIEKLNE